MALEKFEILMDQSMVQALEQASAESGMPTTKIARIAIINYLDTVAVHMGKFRNLSVEIPLRKRDKDPQSYPLWQLLPGIKFSRDTLAWGQKSD